MGEQAGAGGCPVILIQEHVISPDSLLPYRCPRFVGLLFANSDSEGTNLSPPSRVGPAHCALANKLAASRPCSF